MNRLFASQHHFDLDDSDLLYPKRKFIDKKSFKDFVDKTLLVSRSNSIKKLSLKYQDNPLCFVGLEKWTHNVLERGLMDLELHFKTSYPCLITPEAEVTLYPWSVFANKTLVKLTLGIEMVCLDMPRYPEVYLPMLKSLCLHGDWYLNQGLAGMLSGCPILEELSLHYFASSNNNLRNITVTHKTLQRLTLHYNDSLTYSGQVTFDTPSLVYLDYSGFPPLRPLTHPYSLPLNPSKVAFADSIVEAKLDLRMARRTDDLSPIIDWISNDPFLDLWFCRDEGVCIASSKVKVLEIYGFRGSDTEFRQVKRFLCQMQFLQVMKVEIDDADDYMKPTLISRLIDLLPEPSSKCQIQLL